MTHVPFSNIVQTVRDATGIAAKVSAMVAGLAAAMVSSAQADGADMDSSQLSSLRKELAQGTHDLVAAFEANMPTPPATPATGVALSAGAGPSTVAVVVSDSNGGVIQSVVHAASSAAGTAIVAALETKESAVLNT